MQFGTKIIKATIQPDPSTGSVTAPIYQTSTFQQSAPGDHQGYEYARSQNPTRHLLEKAIATLENAEFGACFGSGMAAIDAILRLLLPGDEVISTNDLYGGSYRLFKQIFEPLGIVFKFVDMIDLGKLESAITDQTKMIWTETPTNPLLNIIDIAGVKNCIKNREILLVTDNTFASPYLQNPIDLGADIVMHSATKYLGGHSDVVLGAVLTNNEALAQKIHFIQKSTGGICGPQDAFLVTRGIKTLHLRMEQHCKSAEAIAKFLRQHPKVDQVYWPGFEGHKGHEIAKRQMRGFGGMVSFALKEDTQAAANKVLSNTNIFVLAESLGGVESLIGHPASMTHASIPVDERREIGIVDSLIRLSIGVEGTNDLIEDLNQALNH